MWRFTLLLVITFIAAGCTSAASHYQSHGDGPSLYRVLYKNIRTGQSIDQVRDCLGPGEIPSDQDKFRDIQRRILAKEPSNVPGGVEDDDQFVLWQYDGHPVMMLQFRDNILVNHQPDLYKTYEPFRSVR